MNKNFKAILSFSLAFLILGSIALPASAGWKKQKPTKPACERLKNGTKRCKELPPRPPKFPSCKRETGIGDWSHSGLGYHHIPGLSRSIYGIDDVYYKGDGNFIQCLKVGKKGFLGIQTNWWNIKDEKLTDEQIAMYLKLGWHLEEGSDWNLMDGPYLAFNRPYMAKRSNYLK